MDNLQSRLDNFDHHPRRAAGIASTRSRTRSRAHGVEVRVVGVDFGRRDFRPDIENPVQGVEIGLLVNNRREGGPLAQPLHRRLRSRRAR